MTKEQQQKHQLTIADYYPALEKTDPELAEIIENFAFKEVLQFVDIPTVLQMKVRLAALIASHGLHSYVHLLKAALDAGLTPIEAKEIVYQAIPYVGLSKTAEFLVVTNDILIEQGISLPLTPQATTTTETRFEAGLETVRQVAGDAVDQMLTEMPDNQRHFAVFLADNCFGDYASREGLSISERELLIFSMLSTLGGADSQLKSHIGNNLRVGNDKHCLLDVLTILLPYIGYPRTLTALAYVNDSN